MQQRKADIETLNYIRSRIPEIECMPGCATCCGPTSWSMFEWSLLPTEKRKAFKFHSFTCSFIEDGRCSVHEYRPILCRLYGVVEGIPCQQGVPVETLLDEKTANSLATMYKEVFFGEEL